MDKQPSLQIQTILQPFQILTTAFPQQQALKKAESLLQSLLKHPQFLPKLLEISLIPNISNNITKLIIVYLKKHINATPTNNLKKSLLLIDKWIQSQAPNHLHPDFDLKSIVEVLTDLWKGKGKGMLGEYQQNISMALLQAVNQPNISEVNFHYLGLLSLSLIKSLSHPYPSHSSFILTQLPSLLSLTHTLVSFYITIPPTNISILQETLQLICLYLQSILSHIKLLIFIDVERSMLDDKKMLEIISGCLNINLYGNLSQIPIFYMSAVVQQAEEYSSKAISYFHQIKFKSISIIKILSNLLHSKQPNTYSSTNLHSESSMFIQAFTQSVSNLFVSKTYENISTLIEINIIEAIYELFIFYLNTGLYYQNFKNAHADLIYGCLLRCLSFTSKDYENFVDDPNQFINGVLALMPKDIIPKKENNQPKKSISSMIGPMRRKAFDNMCMEQQQPSEQPVQQKQVQKQVQKQLQDESEVENTQQQPEQFLSLKQISSKLLSCYIQHIDGSDIQLITMCNTILDSVNQKQIFKKDTLILILCIIKNTTIGKQELNYKIGRILVTSILQKPLPFIVQTSFPILTPQKPLLSSVEYTLYLLALQQYLPLLLPQPLFLNISETIFYIIEQILSYENIYKSSTLAVSYIIVIILKTQQGMQNCDKILALLLNTLKPNLICLELLKCIQVIIRSFAQQLSNHMACISQLIMTVFNLIKNYVNSDEIDANTNQVLDKLWKIIEQLTANIFYANIFQLIQKELQQFLPFFNAQKQALVQEPVLRIAASIVKITKSVSQFEVRVIDAVKNGFYNGIAKARLLSSFYFIQNFCYFGVSYVQKNTEVIQSLLKMCCDSICMQQIDQIPRSSSEMCEGALILRNLIISFGAFFKQSMWIAAIQTLENKLTNVINYDFLKVNLMTNLALIYASTSSSITIQMLQNFIKTSKRDIYYFTFKNSPKIFTIAMCQILSHTNCQAIQQSYTQILELTITLLKMIQGGKDQLLEGEDFDCEWEQFKKLQSLMVDRLSYVDEFDVFQNLIMKLKQQNQGLIQNAYERLQEDKKDYLREIMNLRKINNRVRVIYKFKNNK